MSILNIGQSGIGSRAVWAASTTSNNIANASTPGYNREQIVRPKLAGRESTAAWFRRCRHVRSKLCNVCTTASLRATQVNIAQSSYSSLNTQLHADFANQQHVRQARARVCRRRSKASTTSVQTAQPRIRAPRPRARASDGGAVAGFPVPAVRASSCSQISQGVNTQLQTTSVRASTTMRRRSPA